jgi:hypothetical protein
MTQLKTARRIRLSAWLAVAGVFWLASASTYAEEAPFGEPVVSTSFRLASTECLDGRGEEDAFDLGLGLAVGFDWHESADPAPAPPALTGIVPPSRIPDHNTQPAPTETADEISASDAKKENRIPDKPYGWKQLRYDVRYVIHKPAHLDRKEKRSVVAIAGTTGLLYVFRKDIQESWQDSKTEERSDFLSKARITGGAAFAPAVALTAYLASFATHNDREKETAQLVLESWALSSVGAGIGQIVLATERPEDGDAIRFFKPDGHGVSFDVAVAASVIPPLRRQYLRIQPGDKLGRKILKHGLSALLYSGMVFTALQRIDANKHWAPDVFLGGVIGLGVGRTLGQAHDQAAVQRRPQLGISTVRGGVAVTLTLNLDPR